LFCGSPDTAIATCCVVVCDCVGRYTSQRSAVTFAVQISELTFFALQASEETSRPILMYGAVTILYFISAFAVNRVAAFIEKRVQVPGMIGGGK